MQKIILGLFMIFLTLSSLNGDNEPMSNDEFMKQFLSSKKALIEEQKKTKSLKEEAKRKRAETKALEEQTKALEKITKALEKAKNQKTTKKIVVFLHFKNFYDSII